MFRLDCTRPICDIARKGRRRNDATALATSKATLESLSLAAKSATVAQHERVELARCDHAIELDMLRKATRVAEERFPSKETR